jgi:hypothetical protein
MKTISLFLQVERTAHHPIRLASSTPEASQLALRAAVHGWAHDWMNGLWIGLLGACKAVSLCGGIRYVEKINNKLLNWWKRLNDKNWRPQCIDCSEQPIFDTRDQWEDHYINIDKSDKPKTMMVLT